MKKGKLKEIINKIIFELKCRKADRDYYIRKSFVIDSCFKLKDYPPSFFMKHTEEEAAAIMEKDREEILASLQELFKEYEEQIKQEN